MSSKPETSNISLSANIAFEVLDSGHCIGLLLGVPWPLGFKIINLCIERNNSKMEKQRY